MKKATHKEFKRTTILWKLETRVIKIVERKEVAAALEVEVAIIEGSRSR